MAGKTFGWLVAERQFQVVAVGADKTHAAFELRVATCRQCRQQRGFQELAVAAGDGCWMPGAALAAMSQIVAIAAIEVATSTAAARRCGGRVGGAAFVYAAGVAAAVDAGGAGLAGA